MGVADALPNLVLPYNSLKIHEDAYEPSAPTYILYIAWLCWHLDHIFNSHNLKPFEGGIFGSSKVTKWNEQVKREISELL